jgi:VWFA-related protein
LTASDFTILENGAPQKIVAFSETFIPDPEPSPTAWIRDVAPDVRTNILPEGRLIILVLDDAMLPFDPAIVRNAKAIGRGVVERLGPSDLAAVVFTRDNRNAQDFTTDRTRLLAAVDKVSAGFVFAEGSDEYFHRSSIGTLTKAAEYLAAVPDRRKALVYVSVGIPFDTEKLTEAVQFGTFGDVQGSVAVMLKEMQTTFRDAHRSNVTIYGVDPAGLNGLADYFLRRYRLDHAAAELRARPFREYLQTVSENTGGRAIINTNDPASEVPQIFRETGAYYMVGYEPTNRSADGKFRRLDIRVSRAGATVFSRKGYFAPKPEQEGRTAAAQSSLVTALTGLLPRPDLPMAVSVSPFAIKGTQKRRSPSSRDSGSPARTSGPFTRSSCSRARSSQRASPGDRRCRRRVSCSGRSTRAMHNTRCCPGSTSIRPLQPQNRCTQQDHRSQRKRLR